MENLTVLKVFSNLVEACEELHRVLEGKEICYPVAVRFQRALKMAQELLKNL